MSRNPEDVFVELDGLEQNIAKTEEVLNVQENKRTLFEMRRSRNDLVRELRIRLGPGRCLYIRRSNRMVFVDSNFEFRSFDVIEVDR